MRIAIFFCLVAICQGFYVRDEISELLELLKTSGLSRPQTNPFGPQFIHRHAMNTEMEPWEYDLDRLFEFPGSNFLLKLIERNFSDSTPLSRVYMQDFPSPQSPELNTYISVLEPKFIAATYMFYGEWEDLADLFTRRITEWVAYRRFACPSVLFDKIFTRWNFRKLESMLESEDESLFEVFRTRVANIFPEYPETQINDIAEEATVTVHSWIMEQFMQHIIGYGLKDVGVFSHKVYRGLVKNYNMTMTRCPPQMTSPGYLGKYVMSVMQDSNVRCHTGPEIFQRYTEAISVFKSRHEEYSVTAIRSVVINFLNGKMGEPTMDGFNEADVDIITTRIRKYFEEILEEFIKYEPYFTTSGVTSLETFFKEMMEPEEIPFLMNLFRRLELNMAGNVNMGFVNPVNSIPYGNIQ